MFMSRDIMQCRPGKVKDMVSKFKFLSQILVRKGYPGIRVYTDVSGEDYWTVVSEQDFEDPGKMMEMARQAMSDKEFADAMAGYHELVQSARRELYKVEQASDMTREPRR